MTRGYRSEVPRWVGVSLFVTPLPDLDFVLPWFTHRGVSHSLVAAICLGMVVAVLIEARWGSSFIASVDSRRRLLFGFLLGTGSVVSHLLGDIITPMGIRPLFPFGSVYSLNLVAAKNIHANIAFLVIGVMVFLAVYRLSKDPAPPDGATASDPGSESDLPPV